jgi:hypothetical protein
MAEPGKIGGKRKTSLTKSHEDNQGNRSLGAQTLGVIARSTGWLDRLVDPGHALVP